MSSRHFHILCLTDFDSNSANLHIIKWQQSMPRKSLKHAKTYFGRLEAPQDFAGWSRGVFIQQVLFGHLPQVEPPMPCTRRSYLGLQNEHCLLARPYWHKKTKKTNVMWSCSHAVLLLEHSEGPNLDQMVFRLAAKMCRGTAVPSLFVNEIAWCSLSRTHVAHDLTP